LGILKTVHLLIFVALSFVVNAQPSLFKNIADEGHLPKNLVYSMVQDSFGNLWLGSEMGLVRYDGRWFVHYVDVNANFSSVSDVRIDKHGAVRCQSFSGRHFYLENDTLKEDKQLPNVADFSPVLEASDSATYHLAMNKVYRQKNQTDTISSSKQILGIFEHSREVWAFDDGEIFSLSSKRRSYKHHLDLKNETVYFMINTGGKVFALPRIIVSNIAYQIFPTPKEFTIAIPNVPIQAVNIIYDSIIAVGTKRGVYLFNKAMQPLYGGRAILPQVSVSSVLSDADGALWVSTVGSGLYRADCFDCVSYPFAAPVLSFFVPKNTNRFYCGTADGEVYYRPEKGATLERQFATTNPQRIVGVYEDGAGNLFVAGDFLYVKAKDQSVSEYKMAVKKMINSSEGVVLARTGGVSEIRPANSPIFNQQATLDYQDKKWKVGTIFTRNEARIRISSVAKKLGSSVYYTATSLGLVEFDRDASADILHNGQLIIARDLAMLNDTLYALTNTELLMVLNRQVIASTKLIGSGMLMTTKNIRIHQGELWVSMGSGIKQMNTRFETLAVHEIANGEEINDFSFTDDELLIATGKGVIAKQLRTLQAQVKPLPLMLAKIESNGVRLDMTEKNVLPHTSNNIKISLYAPYYGKLEELTIQYKVNDNEWMTLDKGLSFLSFVSLEPGNYVISIQSTTTSGRVSEPLILRFSIKPPFWQTIWFYLLSLFTVAALAYWVYRYRLNFVQKQNDLERQKIELENKLRESVLASVKAQMNPHFIFNALNSIQSFIYLDDKKNAIAYLTKFSQLTRTILDMSNKNEVTLQEEIDAILIYLELEKMRFDDTMQYTVSVASNINAATLYLPSMIIQPYIENAIKHGLLHKKGERWLTCSFEMEGGFLKVTVDDNGIGRLRSGELNKKRKDKHQSFATQANEKRLDALNHGTDRAVSVQFIDKYSAVGQAMGTTIILLIAVDVEDKILAS